MLTNARSGSSVELTINDDEQYHVQSVLSTQLAKLKADFGTAVVLDVRTGAVVAQASYPSYDASNPPNDPSLWTDAASQTVFYPGSIHKAIVMGAALQEGVITPSSTMEVDPAIYKGGYRFEDSEPQKAGTVLTIPGILALSSDVGTIKVADLLGKDKLVQYQKAFGLGTSTGEGLPNEASGALLPAAQWSGSAAGSVPIGYTITTTEVQMAAAYAAIANDGVYVQPHLVKAIVGPDGTTTPAAAPETHRVLSAQVAQELRTMLEGVVTLDHATGTQAAIPGYRIAGKTGTSELVKNGSYTTGETTSFIGMAPADAPRYVIAVTAHVPPGASAQAGGTVAAPLFRDMMAFTLSEFGVLPTGTTPPKLDIYAKQP